MIIAIDYDGTIADTNREKVKWIAAQLGKRVSPWMCNRTDCVPLIGLDAYEKMGAAVYEQERTLQAVEVPGALDALRMLAARASLHVVTARPARRLAYARQWLEEKSVLACFDHLHTSAGSTKAAICATIGADILIDDDIRHLQNIRLDGLQRILLQDGRKERPDCRSEIHFCSNWKEAVLEIAAIEKFADAAGVKK